MMMKRYRSNTPTTLLTAVATACLTLGAWAGLVEPAAAGAPSGAQPVEEELSSGWIANETDNVCGVRVARHITNPVAVRYDELLDATPEVQRMKREGIDRDSAQGKVLYATAVDRVRTAADRIMSGGGYCSVWKQIRHRDGRAVPDVTAEVRAEI